MVCSQKHLKLECIQPHGLGTGAQVVECGNLVQWGLIVHGYLEEGVRLREGEKGSIGPR